MTPAEQEDMFQRAFDSWEASAYTDKESWDEMFFRVIEACTAIGKKLCTGINNPLLEERCMDAAIYYMGRIKKDHIRPKKLSSFCYYYTLGQIRGKDKQMVDREISWDDYIKSIDTSLSCEYR